MFLLALYIPRPEELFGSILILTIIFTGFIALAYRMRMSPWIAAAIMCLGTAFSLTPDLLPLRNSNLGNYGDMARKLSHVDYSDAFFEVTAYMYVGRGQLVAIGGMAGGLIVYAVIHTFRNRNRTTTRPGQNPDGPRSDAPEPGA